MQRIESYLPPQPEASSSKQASQNNGHHTRLHRARNSHSEYRQRTGPLLREPCSSPYNPSNEAKSVHDNMRTEPRLHPSRLADLPPHRGRYHPYGGENPRDRRSPFGSLDYGHYDTRTSFSGRKYVSDRRVRPLDDHAYRDYPVCSPR
ncbi:hypothetical protein VKT23_011631 [Stygiomarasmius scandens]|uniref:Uncharacterized protein n=1 Tax=Marasmiellus scandens TaxID=2682957 RepID=A0ABR1J8E6_9AGAR